MFVLVLLIFVSNADSENVPSFHQNPEVRYLPHGIQLLAPTVPPPARRKYLNLPSRRAQPQDLSLDLSPAQTPKGYKDLFGPDPLGPSPIGQRDLSLSRIPKYRGQFRPQPFRLETFGRDRDPSLPKENDGESSHLVNGQGILDGPPALRLHLQQAALGSEPWAVYRPDRPPGPFGQRVEDHGLYPLGLQNSFRPPMNPWYGLPVPTAMGPYSQRRLKPFVPLKVQTSLSPLREIEGAKKKDKPYDSWQGAQQRDRVRPPSLEQFGPLAPPQMGDAGKHNPAQEYAPESEEGGVPRYPGEKGYVPPVTRKKYVTPGFLQHLTESQESTSRTPPPLLDDHDGFLIEELVPESNDVSLFSRERKLPKLADSAPNTFDAILS